MMQLDRVGWTHTSPLSRPHQKELLKTLDHRSNQNFTSAIESLLWLLVIFVRSDISSRFSNSLVMSSDELRANRFWYLKIVEMISQVARGGYARFLVAAVWFSQSSFLLLSFTHENRNIMAENNKISLALESDPVQLMSALVVVLWLLNLFIIDNIQCLAGVLSVPRFCSDAAEFVYCDNVPMFDGAIIFLSKDRGSY